MFKNMWMDLATNSFEIFLLITIVIALIFILIELMTAWKLFDKAERNPVYSLIPIYNLYHWSLIITGAPTAFMLMCVIALLFVTAQSVSYVIYVALAVFVIFDIWISFKTAKVYNKNWSYALATAVCPFLTLIFVAFGDTEYTDPSSEYYDGVLSYKGELHEDINTDNYEEKNEIFKPVDENDINSEDIKRVEVKKQPVKQNTASMNLTDLVKQYSNENKEQ